MKLIRGQGMQKFLKKAFTNLRITVYIHVYETCLTGPIQNTSTACLLKRDIIALKFSVYRGGALTRFLKAECRFLC
jgi:hypothetical protein